MAQNQLRQAYTILSAGLRESTMSLTAPRASLKYFHARSGKEA